MQELRVHNLPRQIAESELAGSTVVVIDLLRATSTICQALAAGASDVVPFLEIDEALAAAAKAGRDRTSCWAASGTAGRSPASISAIRPREYTPEAVGGRPRVHHHDQRHAGTAPRPAGAARAGRRVREPFGRRRVCSRMSRASTFCARAPTATRRARISWPPARSSSDLSIVPTATWQLNDAAAAAAQRMASARREGRAGGPPARASIWRSNCATRPAAAICIDIGIDRDLVDCAQIDRLDVVPELDVPNWRITAR